MKKNANASSTKPNKVSAQFQGMRLDHYLRQELLTELSRSQIQRLIKDGVITVNDAPASVHQFLKPDDIIVVKKLVLDKKAKAELKQKMILPDIRIIADENDFLVIEKPAGILIHPTNTSQEATIVEWLLAKYPKVKDVGEDLRRPGIIHRLDRDVSGLVLIAKTQPAFDYFKEQFKQRKMTKRYLALVEGSVIKDDDDIRLAISRSKSYDGRMAAHPASQEVAGAKHAWTHFTVRRRWRKYSLLDVQIITGRSHQIRTHLLAYGHPIVGDPLYRIRKSPKSLLIQRPFLHAYHLAFTDRHGEAHQYQIDLPVELESILEGLK